MWIKEVILKKIAGYVRKWDSEGVGPWGGKKADSGAGRCVKIAEVKVIKKQVNKKEARAPSPWHEWMWRTWISDAAFSRAGSPDWDSQSQTLYLSVWFWRMMEVRRQNV